MSLLRDTTPPLGGRIPKQRWPLPALFPPVVCFALGVAVTNPGTHLVVSYQVETRLGGAALKQRAAYQGREAGELEPLWAYSLSECDGVLHSAVGLPR